MTRKPYPSDVSDDEWAFVSPYLTLMTEDAPQREHSLREVFNGLRWIVRTGAQWRMMPNDVPPWHTVYQQSRRWLRAGVFEAMVHDLRLVLRAMTDRPPQPRAAIIDSRTLQSSPESGARAGYDGAKRRRGSKTHIAVDTLGQLLAVVVTPANEQDRAQVAELAARVQEVTGESVAVAFVDQGYTGEQPAQTAAEQGIRLEVVKLPTTKRGFIVLPRRWVVDGGLDPGRHGPFRDMSDAGDGGWLRWAESARLSLGDEHPRPAHPRAWRQRTVADSAVHGNVECSTA